MLRLSIGSCMLRLRLSIGSCMLRLRLSIGSCMLRLRLSFRGSGFDAHILTFDIGKQH